MADIKDRIKQIKPYFNGMQVENVEGEQVIYVVVSFPKKWFIVEGIEEKFDVVVEKGTYEGDYIFITELGKGFDVLFDAIDYNVNEMKIAQERAELLQQKIFELKELFTSEDIPIDALRKLEFSYKGKKRPLPQQKQQKNTEVDEENKENIIDKEEKND